MQLGEHGTYLEAPRNLNAVTQRALNKVKTPKKENWPELIRSSLMAFQKGPTFGTSTEAAEVLWWFKRRKIFSTPYMNTQDG